MLFCKCQTHWLCDCKYHRAEGKGLCLLEVLTVKMQGCLCKVCGLLDAFPNQKLVCNVTQNLDGGKIAPPLLLWPGLWEPHTALGEAEEQTDLLLWCLHLGQPLWSDPSCCPVQAAKCKCSLPSPVAVSNLSCSSSHTRQLHNQE